jgi:hypothetical protein
MCKGRWGGARRGAEDEHTLLDRARSRDANKGLAGTAWQDDNAGPRTPAVASPTPISELHTEREREMGGGGGGEQAGTVHAVGRSSQDSTAHTGRVRARGRGEVLAHPSPNILLSDFSWYGRMLVDGRRSMASGGLRRSPWKSYSSSAGCSSTIHRRLTS